MAPKPTLPQLFVPASLSVIVLALSLVVSTGHFTLDELVYHIGAHTLATTGGFTFDNGYATFQSPDLRLVFLTPGPNGPTPQYPIGSAVLGAPMLALFGVRGLIVLNALAVAVTLFATRALAMRLFDDDRLANVSVLLLGLCTFITEYAFGIWPHALSVAAVTIALWCTISALDAEGRQAFWRAASAGAAVGAGLLIRADTVLILPTIGLSILLFARAPLTLIAAGALGMLPFLAAGSVANATKFGTYNPLSYGHSEGPTSIETYLPLAAILAIAAASILVLRQPITAVLRRRPSLIWIAVSAGGIAAIVIPDLRGFLQRLLHGGHLLLVDATAIPIDRNGIERQPDGTLLFWGQAKKALGQSMPWIALLLALFSAKPRPRDGRSLAISIAAVLIWILPFVYLAWYGGLSRNMRYFLPVVPVLTVLGAYLWCRVLDEGTMARVAKVFWPIAGVAAVVGWSTAHPTATGGAQQILSTWALIVFAVAATLTYLPVIHHHTQALARVCFLTGTGIAFAMGILLDVPFSQIRRNATIATGEMLNTIEGPALVFFSPEFAAPLVFREDIIVGAGDALGNNDIGLINDAIAQGYKVYLEEPAAEKLIKDHAAFEISEPTVAGIDFILVELTAYESY